MRACIETRGPSGKPILQWIVRGFCYDNSVVRDFLYQDGERVRSLLAQLDGGVVEEVVEKVKTSGAGEARGGVFGLFDLRTSLARENAAEQTKTMQDALYLVFEEAAERLGLFTDITELADPESWRSGSVHAQIREGQLLRCHAPTRILDARLFRERTHRFMEWAVAATRLEAHDSEESAIPESDVGEDELVNQTRRDLAHIPIIGDLYGLLMAEQISIRQFPCGPDAPELCLAGTLLARPDYLQEEREALFGKYGSSVSDWTVVAQVATLPRAAADTATLPEEIDPDRAGAERRMFFEELATFGMRTFEEQGFVEAPTFPAIHVTPLAVYREVPVVSG